MKALLVYMFEAAVCSGILQAAYAWLLERRVPHRWCRIYLLLSVPLAAVIPLLRIPVWPGEVITMAAPTAGLPTAQIAAEPLASPAFDPTGLFVALLALGTALLAGVMVAQIIRIRHLRRGAEITRTRRFTLIRTLQKIASFSFLRSIYVWQQTPAEELEAIVRHEMSHIAHRHSVERLAMESMKALLWWNPFVWIAARRLTEAEEFEADSDVLKEGYDKELYMHVIFRQLFGYSPEIANGLRSSLTKKRFQMMLSQTPGRHALLRLAGTLPAIAGLLCAFSFTTRAAEIRTTTETVQAADDEKNVSFYIADNQDGKPLSGTLIRIEGTSRGTVTDETGYAEIEAAPGSTIQISHIGYETREVRVSEDNEPIRYLLMMERSEAPGREQAATPDNDDDTVLVAEQMPTFQGGDLNTFRNWVQEGLRYPQGALDAGIQGRVVITFVVGKEGSITDIKILQSPDTRLSDEVIRRLRESPKWTPARDQGKLVRIKYVIPIDFRLSQKPEQAAATTAAAATNDEPYLVVEQMPTFQGGDLNTFRNWVLTHLRYPQEAAKQGTQGRVVLTFVVEKDGSIGEVCVLMSPDEQLAGEAVRVVQSASGLWTPGEQRGEKVRLKYAIPIDFRLNATKTPTGEPETATPATDAIG